MVICEPIIGCCEQFWIEIPPAYLEATIGIRIVKGNGVYFQQTIVVEDGMVEIPLDEIGNDWFNPYGGPYTLQYIDPATNLVIPFQYDGNTVTGVQWTMAPGLSDVNICTLDIF